MDIPPEVAHQTRQFVDPPCNKCRCMEEWKRYQVRVPHPYVAAPVGILPPAHTPAQPGNKMHNIIARWEVSNFACKKYTYVGRICLGKHHYDGRTLLHHPVVVHQCFTGLYYSQLQSHTQSPAEHCGPPASHWFLAWLTVTLKMEAVGYSKINY